MTGGRAAQTGPIDWAGTDRPGALRVTEAARPAFLADLATRLREGRGFCVATLNLDHLVKLRRQPEFRRIYAYHTHVTADGNPILWLSRLAGRKVDLITGSDLMTPALALARDAGVGVALVGSTESTLAAAVAALEKTVPGLNVVWTCAPAMGFQPDSPAADAVIDGIAQSGAGLCLLALGSPKQEFFAVRAFARLPSVGFLSIGAGIDFIAGTQRRAPRWVRAIAAEWLWRMTLNPRRLAGRYAACAAVLPSEARNARADGTAARSRP